MKVVNQLKEISLKSNTELMGKAKYNLYRLFVLNYNCLPQVLEIQSVKIDKVEEWLNANYKESITLFLKHESTSLAKSVFQFQVVYQWKNNQILISLNRCVGEIEICYAIENEDLVQNLIHEFKKFKKREVYYQEINLLVGTTHSLVKVPLRINKPKLKIEDNYNDDFLELHNLMSKKLRNSKSKGLVILHGKPGTGKTSYIRHLICSIKKEIIFLPPDLASVITHPNFINILLRSKGAILVIEDAEKIILEREQSGSSAVTEILNITDGLLSDVLNIQIICSFNTEIAKVDKALLRKGRLIAKYEFKELEIDKANALSNKLGLNRHFTQPTVLTDIYNQHEKFVEKSSVKKSIGFNLQFN
ncbi:AAA family ATPase [Pelobium sp.]|nr:AAA family ATPase [Pelobium sp.]MDA9555400.1 AAA family ATPase [Pelobium sp.]